MSNVKNCQINLNGQTVSYSLKTSARARNLRITVKPGGTVAAVKPAFISDRAVEEFLAKKSGWLIGKIDLLKNKKSLAASGTRADFKRCAPLARALALRKIEKYKQIYKLDFNRVAIRNQSTRWGSCSCKGNLNFNYRIVLLPERLADYIVVHEMCHLRELNHSRNFWNLVAVAFPDYACARKELKNIVL
jgi:hypothetical protein